MADSLLNFTLINSSPKNLSFNTTKTVYNQGEIVKASGWVFDDDGYQDLQKVDWWIKKDGGSWQNISDSFSFNPWASNSDWASFNKSISGLSVGKYTLWGRAFDDDGAFSNSFSKNFSIIAAANKAPKNLSFNTTKTVYNQGEIVKASGWVFDDDGYQDLQKVDWWIKKDGGSWQNISDSFSFNPWASNSDWASFNKSISGLSVGKYTLWGRAFDDDGAFSNSYTDSFTIVNKKVNLKGAYFNVSPEPLHAGETFDIDFRIKNTEVGNSGGFYVNFYLSDNNIISTADKLIGSQFISNVNGNSTSGTLTKTITLKDLGDAFWNGFNDNNYHIGMLVDAKNDVAETNESDNKNQGWLVDYDDVIIRSKAKVTVTVDRVKGDLDPAFNDSDFYSKITIDGNTWKSPVKNGSNDYSPSNWKYSKNASDNSVAVAIQLWDDDSGLTFGDDHADIDPKAGLRDVNINLDLGSGTVSGDFSGNIGDQFYAKGGGGDSDPAEMWFTVDVDWV